MLGIPVANTVGVVTKLEQICLYHRLCQKCKAGLGLEWDEIDQLVTIESRYRNGPIPLRIPAKIRSDGNVDIATTQWLDVDRLAVVTADEFAGGASSFEIIIEPADGTTSYRFRGTVSAQDGRQIVFSYQGAPLVLRHERRNRVVTIAA